MCVAVAPKRNAPPAILLRESESPPAKIDALRQVLKGATVTAVPADAFGHAAAAVGSSQKLALTGSSQPTLAGGAISSP
jgi:hypothetical protein